MTRTSSPAPRALRTCLPLALAGGLLAGCGQSIADAPAAEGEPTAPATPVATGPAEVAIRVEQVGGFTTPAMLAARLPVVTVYADGRVIGEGRQIAVFPAPALSGIQVGRISRDDVQKLRDLALAKGVGRLTDLGQPSISDSPTTRFTVVTPTGTKQTEAYALQYAPPSGGATEPADGLTSSQHAARADLQDLLSTLTDPTSLLGAGAVADEGLYEPEAVAAVSDPWVDPGADVAAEPIRWPGAALPGEPVGEGLQTGCVAMTGLQAQQVLAAATKASVMTPWTVDQKRWTVAIRPLLPDEQGCDDLLGR